MASLGTNKDRKVVEDLPSHCWSTLITTPGYIEGVVGLAQSLHLVGSAHPLVCWVTDNWLQDQALSITSGSGLHTVPVIVKLLPHIKEALQTQEDPADQEREDDVKAHAAFFRDAARRFLWFMGQSFIFLDADMIG